MIGTHTIARAGFVALASCMLAACPSLETVKSANTAALAPRLGTAGAVSAADPRAQAAGEQILAQGGNATDAAIAVMLALTVVEPQSSGIGGGGFLVRGPASGSLSTFDGRETAPAGADPQWFMDEAGTVRSFRDSVISGLSVGVPGNIALAAKAHAAHGKLPWADLFAPAMALAKDGFALNRRLHLSLDGKLDHAGLTEEGRALFYKADGSPKDVGTIIRNPALYETFKAVAQQGPDAFYRSAGAAAMAQTVRAATPRTGGMTAADVAGYEAKQRAPLCGSYRGYRICGMGPPTSGGIAVIQMLGQLERFDLTAMGLQNPVTWHLFLESQRLAYADRELYLGDADFVSVPVDGLIAPDYIATRSQLIDPARAMPVAEAGIPRGVTTAYADGDEGPELGTSHLAVVDSEGTMVSYTSTIEGAFGSGLMHGGFYLNNELTDFSRSPDKDGVPVANRVEGGKRPRSSMSPMVIYDPQGRPFAAIGAAGGATIPVQTTRSIIGIIDFGLSIDEALGLPFVMAFSDQVLVEQGSWLDARKNELTALGHQGVMARVPSLKAGGVLWNGSNWISGRDPRLDGMLANTP